MLGRILASDMLSWAVGGAGCVTGRVCSDDSGPNLLVRTVEFLIVLALAMIALWVMRRIRRRFQRDV